MLGRLMASILGYEDLFPLAATPKYTSEQRQASLRDRMQRVKESHKHDFANVEIDASFGPLVLRAGPIVLVTVLEEDLPDYYNPQMSASVRRKIELRVARLWASILQEDLDVAATMNTQAYRTFAMAVIALLLLSSAIIHRSLSYLGRSRFHSPLWPFKGLVWTFSICLSLRLFVESQNWGRWVEQYILTPALLISVGLALGALIVVVGDWLVKVHLRTILEYKEDSDDPRLRLRIDTYAGAVGWVIRLLVFLGGGLYCLHRLGLETSSSLASMGALSVAVGYLAQDTIKNASAGLLVLAEDRYGLGDWLESDRFSGKVECFDLFTTRLRDMQGSLITVPNGLFDIFKNCSKLWSQVDFRVGVAYSTNLEQAIDILMEEAGKVVDETPECVPGSLQWIGVENLGDSAITLRLVVRTVPAKHWQVGRKLNLRVKNRFDQEGIEIPFPQMAVWSRQDLSEGAPDPGTSGPQPKPGQ